MRRSVLALLLAPAAACGGRGEEMELRPTPDPLVDNLFVQQRRGDVSTMNLANGTFRLTGRCLTVDTGAGPRTPVFALPSGDIAPSAGGIALGGSGKIEFGRLYALPGAVPGPRIGVGAAGRCPRDTLLIRGIERLEDLPEPKMPPLKPEPR